MTVTSPRSATTALRRRSAVYGIPVLAVDEHGIPLPVPTVVVGYIGQTVQTVKTREDQHREDQPFGDLIVAGSWTIEEGYWTAEELDERERHYIRSGVPLTPGGRQQRPIYNYHHNEGNPQRIEIWRAIKHRQVREPGWVKPTQPGQVRIPRQRAPQPVAYRAGSWLSRWWGRRRWWVLGLSAVWVVLFAGACWVARRVWDGWDVATAGAVSATAPFALVQGTIWYRRVRSWWRRTVRPWWRRATGQTQRRTRRRR